MPQASATKRTLSLATALSLGTAAVVVAVLAAGVLAVWFTLRQSAVDNAQDRLARSVRQLAGVAATNVRQSQRRYTPIATDSTIQRVLRTPAAANDSADVRAVRAVLARLQTPTDSGRPIELWSASGRRIAFVGHDVADSAVLHIRRDDTNPASVAPPFRPGLDSIVPVDSLQLGALYAVGSRVFAWAVRPISIDHRIAGFVVQQAQIGGNPETERTLRELSGDSVSGYYRNVDGTGWTTLAGRPIDRPFIDAEKTVRDGSSNGARAVGPLIVADQRIEGTPLAIVMTVPRSSLLTRSRAIIGRLVLLALILVILGGAFAWFIGYHASRPLARVTGAAAEVAGGDYAAQVPVTGTYEVAQLSDSFNRMVRQIGDSRTEVERREDELRRTLESLREARDAAEAASRAKSQFLAAMSHELRTPLNAIGGYAELMELGLRGPVSPQQKHDFARIRASQQHLLSLIGSLLDLSRIESGRVSYAITEISVGQIFTEVEALVAPQAASRRQTLRFQPVDHNLVVCADREKLRQILLNLLSNAIRHTPEGTTIDVGARPCSGETLELMVQDTGPGIPVDRRESVFDPFVQLDRSFAKSTDGVGLGLAISRDLARGMGGDLTIADGDGQGACFVVRLPGGATRG